jgi:transcriptional regulator with XRE-family HTH domain
VRALLDALRQARTREGVTSRDLSLRLGYSHGVVSHWETGRRVPTPEDVATLLGALGIIGPERDRILTLARDAAEPNWLTVGMPGLPAQLADVLDHERAADAIDEWAPATVPGLLQTTEYTRALYAAHGRLPAEVAVRGVIQGGRREVLTRTHRPVEFTALVSEVVLRELVGTPQVMAEQLHDLLALSARPTVTIRVMPLGAGALGLLGQFVRYHLPAVDDVVRQEHLNTVSVVTERVKDYSAAWDVMLARAVNVQGSLQCITEIATDWEKADG